MDYLQIRQDRENRSMESDAKSEALEEYGKDAEHTIAIEFNTLLDVTTLENTHFPIESYKILMLDINEGQ